MDKRAILHIPDSKYCYAVDDKTVEIVLRVSSEDRFDAVEIIYGNKYDYYEKQQSHPLTLKFCDGTFGYYCARLTLNDVRLVYIFRLVCGEEVLYYCEDGVTNDYDFKFAYFNSFQLPFINRADIMRRVDWLTNAVFYEIFVDRFCNSGRGNKAYVNLNWGEIPNAKSYAGGDLQGIISKLDYLKNLGINALYLTPVFCSDSNHKYDIYDYYNIDPHFGTNEDFALLMSECHKRGIRVVLDAVFNHCSEKLPQFLDVRQHGKESPYYDWFIIDGKTVDRRKPNYQHFGVCKYMPKFNTSCSDAQDFLIDIATHWIEKYDIDGWRLDVSDEVSHDFWRRFRRKVKALKPDAVIIGENWHDASVYLQGDQYDGIMNYAVTKALMDYFANGSLSSKGLAERLSALYMRNNSTANAMMLNLLDSHDTDRFFTVVNKNLDKLLCALALLFCHTGSVCVYYGTEVPLEGGYDPDCRRTMDWEAKKAPTAVSELIRRLSPLKQLDAVKAGAIAYRSCDTLFVMERQTEGQTIRLTINNGDKAAYKARNVLLSHNYRDGAFFGTGFVIEEASR
ncbi:MAG: glycoside hydrolase family 13 protein [Clostridia bacterium]|nr:glycoside hydrolase family 13 protein [Clostridia bacterium]